MKEKYLWEIQYQVQGALVFTRDIKVITETDSYGEAEKAAISVIHKQLEDSSSEFLHLTNINPSVVVYTVEGKE